MTKFPEIQFAGDIPEQVCPPTLGCRRFPSATTAMVFNAYHQSGGSSDPQRVCD